MAQIDDLEREWLLSKLPAPDGEQSNDLWLQLFQANGATSDNFNDAASQFLTVQGFTGDLNQQWFDYWAAGGGPV